MNVATGTRRATPAVSLPAVDVRAFGAWLLPFVLVVYLALKGGGYDGIVRGQVGVALWWILLVASVAGVLPLARLGKRGWIAVGLGGALAAWTALGLTWTDSTERTVVEVGRVVTYVGVLALACAALAHRSARYALGGLGTGIAVVAGFAVASRLHPAWFPEDDAAAFLPIEGGRLNYPINYWNGLAALMAMGVPLLLGLAASARTLAGRAAACSALPLVGLCAYMTLSRGGALAIAVGLGAALILLPNRLAAAATAALGGGGAAIAILSATQRDAFLEGKGGALATSQGHEMIAVLLVVCGGVALSQVALALLGRHTTQPRWFRRARRATAWVGLIVLLGGVMGILAGGLPSGLESRWEEFKEPKVQVVGGQERFESSNGRGRYQYWEASERAQDQNPTTGTGPGTFEFWWNEDGTLPGFVRDAHSLYAETYGEMGLVGLGLLLAFLGYALVVGAIRATRRRGRDRIPLATATAAGAAFCASAAVDWVWELAVLPTVLMVLVAVMVVSSDRKPRRQWRGRRRIAVRVATTAVSLAALVAVGIPLLGSTALRDSRDAAAAGDYDRALQRASDAERIQPYSSAPKLQRAVLLEARGSLSAAAVAARDASAAAPRDWRTWLIRARIEAERGNGPAAVRSYRQAFAVYPRGRIFLAR
jgi:hypothetical protein